MEDSLNNTKQMIGKQLIKNNNNKEMTKINGKMLIRIKSRSHLINNHHLLITRTHNQKHNLIEVVVMYLKILVEILEEQEWIRKIKYVKMS